MEFCTTSLGRCLLTNSFTIVLFMLVILTPFASSEMNIHEEPCANPNINRCQCSTNAGSNVIFKVDCSNSKYDREKSKVALSSIPSTVESVVFSGNNMPELYTNIFGNGSQPASCRHMDKLTNLDLSRNNIAVIHGKAFHCMPNLEILILDDNKWKVGKHTRVFSSLISLKTLRLKNSFDGSLAHTGLKDTFNNSFVVSNTRLEEIHLEDNHLKFFNADLFHGLKHLKRVYFSRNNISRVEVSPDTIRTWEDFYVDHNNVTELSDVFLKETLVNAENLKKFDLRGNPFHCDCHFRPTLHWLKEYAMSFTVYLSELQCASPADKAGRNLKELGDHELTCKEGKVKSKESKVRTSYIILGVIFGILGVLFLAVLYLNRFTIQRKLKVHIVEPVRESIMGRSAHGYASVDV